MYNVEFTPRERYEIITALRERQYSLQKEREEVRAHIADGNIRGYDEDFLKFLDRKINVCQSVDEKLGGI